MISLKMSVFNKKCDFCFVCQNVVCFLKCVFQGNFSLFANIKKLVVFISEKQEKWAWTKGTKVKVNFSCKRISLYANAPQPNQNE